MNWKFFFHNLLIRKTENYTGFQILRRKTSDRSISATNQVRDNLHTASFHLGDKCNKNCWMKSRSERRLVEWEKGFGKKGCRGTTLPKVLNILAWWGTITWGEIGRLEIGWRNLIQTLLRLLCGKFPYFRKIRSCTLGTLPPPSLFADRPIHPRRIILPKTMLPQDSLHSFYVCLPLFLRARPSLNLQRRTTRVPS